MSSLTSPERSTGEKPAIPRQISTQDLLRGDKHIVIVHGTEQYRLQLTGNNKLILTK